ncbi:MAG: ATP-grasp domain-containing protein [Acidimicrobiales bacterium]|nr:ATP-grasp domain-containing protein [Acidimicrobiales bacterium]
MGKTVDVGPSSGRAADADLPVLAVVCGAASYGIFPLSEAAAGQCRLAFLLDAASPVARALRRLGPIVDIVGTDDDEALAAARSLSPDGILTFSDPHLLRTSALAEGLGLPFHSARTAAALADKVEQRRVLAAAGLPMPRSLAVPEGKEPLGELDGLRFPVVVKPRNSAGSRDTTLAVDRDQVRQAVAAARADGEAGVVIEEYLPDDPAMATSDVASFVSVESVAGAGVLRHVAVTGKFPLAPPFRETGHFIPSHLGGETLDGVLEVTTRALTGLGITTGCVHTEVKLTPDGPRIIEVNGRVAGAVPDVLLAAGGPSLLRMAMAAALGEVPAGGLAACDRVGYRVNLQPPEWARRVRSVRGIDQLPGPPDVASVTLLRQPGDEVDWRRGTDENVVAVIGATGSLDEVHRLRHRIEETVVVDYE